MGLSYVLMRLQDVMAELTTGPLPLDPPVCRVGLVPRPVATADACGQTCDGTADGQLWASLASTQTEDNEQCLNHKATVHIGVWRCAAVVDDNGQPPEAAAVAADAVQQALDADAIYAVLASDDFKHAFDLVGWTPSEPEGACVGGYWTYTFSVGTCV